MTANVRESKLAYGEKLNSLLDNYQRVILCQMDNVRSMQIHKVRIQLRGKAELLMGKKTMQKRIIALRAAEESASKNDRTLAEKLCDNGEGMLVGNIGMVFTNCEVAEISKVLDDNRIQAPARVGAIAPCDVIVPAGNTGLEPTMTSFFQALSVPTKIAKGTVEITSDKKVLNPGEKVDNSVAALLLKLKISPFYYQMEIVSIWDGGVMFTKEDLSVTDAVIEKQFIEGITNITALSMGAGVPTEASFPHMVMDAFKTLLAVSVETEFVFPEYNGEKLRTDAKEGKLGGGAAAPAAGAAPAKAAAAPAAAADDSDDDDEEGMDLF